MNVITGEYILIPKDEWKIRERKTIKLEMKDWQVLAKHLYGVCIEQECKQTLNLISGTFEELDKAVGKLPLTPGK